MALRLCSFWNQRRAANPTMQRRWRRARRRGSHPSRKRQPQAAGTRLAIQLLAPIAAEQATTARLEEEREQIEAREREQEEAARQLRQRMGRTRRCLVPLVVVLGLAIVGLAVVNANLDQIRSSARTSASNRWVDVLETARGLVVPYSVLAVAGAVLARRSKQRTSRLIWHLMQATCVAASLLLPIVCPGRAGRGRGS